ncbi:MAG: phosphotransferase enzyme family protein [Chitinophagales bacterium]
MLPVVLSAYGLKEELLQITPFGAGLINHTWRIKGPGQDFILQRVNDDVFKCPEDIEENIRLIADYLKQHHPDYLFVAPVKTPDKREMVQSPGNGYFRMFPFVRNSQTVTVVHNVMQAWEAANQFGLFTKSLAGFPVKQLKIPLADFHNLSLRYEQFRQALQNGNPERIRECAKWISVAQDQYDIVAEFEMIKSNPEFKIRVTHHDTKISNVLFDPQDRGLCVIDLDTVMPGYFISDVGDMMRTYLSPIGEEEPDYRQIEIREDFFSAIVKGYLHEMKDELTATEKTHFIYAGKFMIYMQAIRFLTDYLNNDIYYGAKYPGHNLVRAGNQFTLLQRLLEKESLLTRIQTKEFV